MKKITTLLMLVFISSLSALSQEKIPSINVDLQNAEYIFKGTVVSETPFKGENDKDFLISYEINVETIYKGDQLNLGNITLIAKSILGWNESEGYIIPDIVSEYTPEEKNMFKLSVGVSGVFVCNQYNNQLVEVPKTKIEINNTMLIKPIWTTKDCFFHYVSSAKYENNQYIPREYIKGFNQYFVRLGKLENTTSGRIIWDEETTVWEKLDSYLKEQGITPQEENIKKKDVTFLESLEKKKQNEKLYSERVKNAEKRKQLLEERYQRGLNGAKAKCFNGL